MPAFHRKHYQAIASLLARQASCKDGESVRYWVIEDLITLFKADNPDFSESRFRKAADAPIQTLSNDTRRRLA